MNNGSTDAILRRLAEGNERYRAGEMRWDGPAEAERRAGLAAGQEPMAAVLACADSRVPVEWVFDRAAGDLFVVRVAGNVAGPEQTGSLEFAVDALGVPLILVLGHSGCGAVAAAADGAECSPNLGAVLARIAPAVERARGAEPAEREEFLAAAVEANVGQALADLRATSPIIRDAEAAGRVRLAGAVYDLASGRVDFAAG